MATSTILDLFSNKQFFVSRFENDYTWEINFTPKDSIAFLENILDNFKINPNIPYDFGTFIFKDENGKHIIITGEQMITAISILVSVLLLKLHSLRKLTLKELEIYESILKKDSIYKFNIFEKDNQIFRDYVIDNIQIDVQLIESESGKRIVNALDYYTEEIADKKEKYLLELLCFICKAKCKYEIIN